MKKGFYNRFWRWHFFAGIFIAPLLITLTLSGIGYLFFPEVENQLYDDLFFGDSESNEQLTIEEGIEKVEKDFHGFAVTKISIMEEPYNTRLTLTDEAGEQKYVFLDEQNQIVGSQNAANTYSNVMRSIHSSLFVGGTPVNYLVELAACWAIFLLISGLYMTFKGKILTRKANGSKNFRNKKLHALIGVIITIPMVVIIFTGLPWSAVMGNIIYTTASNNAPELELNPPTSDINEIPWATRQEETPASDDPHAHHHGGSSQSEHNEFMISVGQLIDEVESENISKPYSIVYPSADDGVYIVSKGSNSGVTGLDVSPSEEMTTYFDQYSGEYIAAVNYEDYNLLQKWFTWGIPLHEGHLFGWPNKVLNLVVCLAFLFVIFWGFKTWLSRKKKDKFSAPPKNFKGLSIGFIVLMVLLGILMPLFGISLIIVALIECIVIFVKKNKE
ncbi:PepSY domain-containing protein [Cytobacillus sp. FSL R5-0569]|uniref:PepSY-associated TM helix domain-containing protein n=1 Tax=Cytobacillus TaxID=2675230 RepID=UPI002784A2B2|nr:MULTISPECIES: PepSY domain-containing protein [Cytobacillus]MDQ0187492.1 putative iron-regulated membrane protein [Cytobacillus kochii]MEA1855336.1 PepSY domain-containing protein [Cytobacillus sp. OWB-43]